ncbi:MAG: beta-glucosidase [Thiothrix sp.]|nr:MAG: beta-glucosidase [Thiothrix sp.]
MTAIHNQSQPSIEDLVDAMTLEEQVQLLSGEDFWSLPAITRLGLGKLRVTDGPNGARGAGSLIGGVTAAAFPVGIALGASWNPQLAEEVGSALADEVKSKGAHMLLAPTVNLHRSGTNGRNFECYSEDPELTAALAVAYIKGLQAKQVAATIKHFVGNESEIKRTTMSSDIDERSLHELYLRPFEAAVKEAGTWGVMSSYNRLNGTYTADHLWLLTQVLRDEWGFDGLVMSDWFGSSTTIASVNAGLDLEMPGPVRDRGEKLIAAVHQGEVSHATVRTRALNILRVMERTGALFEQTPWQEHAQNRPEHQALIRRAGAESAVLLKNEAMLPLNLQGKRIAVIGPNAKTAQIMGGGSAQLNPHYRISPWQALVEHCGADNLFYAEGCTNYRWQPLLTKDITAYYFDNLDLSGEPVFQESLETSTAFFMNQIGGGKVNPQAFSVRVVSPYTAQESGTHYVGVHSAGWSRVLVDGVKVADAWENWQAGRTFFEQGCDEVVGEVHLEAGQTYEIAMEYRTPPERTLGVAAFYLGIAKPLGTEAISLAAKMASEAEIALLFIGRSGQWDTEGSDLEDLRLPGRQDELAAAVLAANPNTVVVLQTGGPIEMPWLAQAKAILQCWYAGQEAGHAMVDVITGAVEPSGRLPQSFPQRFADHPASGSALQYPGENGHVAYQERLNIGYRHFIARAIQPLFPFGYGLGYTSFDYSDLSLQAEDDAVLVRFKVKNTGEREGSTVAQIYLSHLDPQVEQPPLALKGFIKQSLKPEQGIDLEYRLPARAFAYFDVKAQAWQIDQGRFEISVGTSVAERPLVGVISHEEAWLSV